MSHFIYYLIGIAGWIFWIPMLILDSTLPMGAKIIGLGFCIIAAATSAIHGIIEYIKNKDNKATMFDD